MINTKEEYSKLLKEKVDILKVKCRNEYYLETIVADNGAVIGVNHTHDGIVIRMVEEDGRNMTLMLVERPWRYRDNTLHNSNFLIAPMNDIIETDLEEAMYYLNTIKGDEKMDEKMTKQWLVIMASIIDTLTDNEMEKRFYMEKFENIRGRYEVEWLRENLPKEFPTDSKAYEFIEKYTSPVWKVKKDFGQGSRVFGTSITRCTMYIYMLKQEWETNKANGYTYYQPYGQWLDKENLIKAVGCE